MCRPRLSKLAKQTSHDFHVKKQSSRSYSNFSSQSTILAYIFSSSLLFGQYWSGHDERLSISCHYGQPALLFAGRETIVSEDGVSSFVSFFSNPKEWKQGIQLTLINVKNTRIQASSRVAMFGDDTNRIVFLYLSFLIVSGAKHFSPFSFS